MRRSTASSGVAAGWDEDPESTGKRIPVSLENRQRACLKNSLAPEQDPPMAASLQVRDFTGREQEQSSHLPTPGLTQKRKPLCYTPFRKAGTKPAHHPIHEDEASTACRPPSVPITA
jgi:hypothetical protein